MPSLPGTEERFSVTRGSVTTWFATESEWPFHCPNISPLWDARDVALVNREIAGGDEATYPPVPVGSRRPVTIEVFGMWDVDGDPITGLASQRDQLEENIAHLRSDVVAPVTSMPGTITVELFGVGGGSRGSASAQIIGPLRIQPVSPVHAVVTLDFYFPNGVFDLGLGS